MESESRKHWLPTPASILLISIITAFSFALIFESCGNKKSDASIKYEKLIDSVSSELNKYYVGLQAIDENSIHSIQSEISKYKTDADFSKNENIQTALLTAEKFINSLAAERKSCLNAITLCLNQLQDVKKNASAQLLTKNGNQLQLINSKQYDDAKYQADYLTSRFNAQKLLIETLTLEKHKKVE